MTICNLFSREMKMSLGTNGDVVSMCKSGCRAPFITRAPSRLNVGRTKCVEEDTQVANDRIMSSVESASFRAWRASMFSLAPSNMMDSSLKVIPRISCIHSLCLSLYAASSDVENCSRFPLRWRIIAVSGIFGEMFIKCFASYCDRLDLWEPFARGGNAGVVSKNPAVLVYSSFKFGSCHTSVYALTNACISSTFSVYVCLATSRSPLAPGRIANATLVRILRAVLLLDPVPCVAVDTPMFS